MAKRLDMFLKAVSVAASVVAFLLTLLLFTWLLGWPTSLLTLGTMLGAAWFVGIAFGELVSKTRLSVIVVTLTAVGLIGSTIVFGVPWKLGETDIGAGEIVLFRMDASFTYRGSEDNLPIENVAIRFPCPNVDNVSPKVMAATPSWLLYYMENDNTLTLQATSEQVYRFRGERTATLGILWAGLEHTTRGPKISYGLDKLYPREVFWLVALVEVPEKDMNKITLRDYNDNEGRSTGYYAYTIGENWGNPIDISFWAQLSKKVDDTFETVETFSRSVDNAMPHWSWWLYPS